MKKSRFWFVYAVNYSSLKENWNRQKLAIKKLQPVHLYL